MPTEVNSSFLVTTGPKKEENRNQDLETPEHGSFQNPVHWVPNSEKGFPKKSSPHGTMGHRWP